MFKKNDSKIALIINADDLGYSSHRDEAIFDLFKRGKISSASLIVNGPTAKLAVKRSLAVGLPLGLHINLTEGSPLTRCCALKKKGKMPYKNMFREMARQNTFAFRQAVTAEVKAQLKLFKTLTGQVAKHVDGHQHVHVAPNIPALLAPIFKVCGVESVRIPEEWTQEYQWLSTASKVHYYTRYVDAVGARVVFGRSGFKMNDHTVGMGMSGHEMTLVRLIQRMANKKGIVEMIVHPGFDGSKRDLKTFNDQFDTNSGRVHEWNILKEFHFTSPLTSWADF